MPKWPKKEHQVKALQDDNLQIIEILIRNGADLYAEDNQGKTPLQTAVVNNNLPVIEHLIKCGARIDYTTPSGSAVHFSVLKGTVETFRLLASLGANLDLEDAWGRSPLLLAVSLSKKEFVEALLEEGANPHPFSFLHCTPLTLAAQKDDCMPFEVYLKKHIPFNPTCYLSNAPPNGKVHNFLEMVIKSGIIPIPKSHNHSLF